MKIPNGWEKIKFGDVVSKINNKVPNREEWTFDKYVGGQHFDEGEIRISRSSPIEGNEEVIGSAFHMRFKPGQVLYVTRNPRLRKGGMVDFEGVCSNVSFVMEADEKRLLQSLLPFIIQTEDFVKHTTNNAHGSTNPFLNWKDIAKYEFLLPPLEEQKKISEILWEAEDNIINSEKYLDKLKIFQKKTIIKLIYIKNKYKLIKFRDIIEFSKEKALPPYSVEKYIGLEHIDSGISTCNKFINATNVQSVTSRFKKGDILYGKLRPYLDKAVIATFDGICTTEILVFNANDKSTNEFLMLHIRTKEFINYNTRLGFGTKMPRTSVDIISNYKIHLPPVNEQKYILNITDKLEKIIADIKSTIISLKNLRNKLSNELLSGKLRLN